jgi:hypothetical protein
MNAIFLICALAGQTYQKPLLDIGRDVFALEDKAYLVLPPQSICADVQEMAWSPEGRSLLFRSTESGPEVSAIVNQLEGREVPPRFPASRIGLYTAQSGTTRWFTGLPKDAMPQGIQWTSETTAVVETFRPDPNGQPAGQPHEELFFLSTNSSKLVPVGSGSLRQGEYLNVISDPLTGMTLLTVRRLEPSDPGQVLPPTQAFELSLTGQVLPVSGSIKEAIDQHWEPGFPLPGKGIVFYSFRTGASLYRLLTPKMVFEPWTRPENFDFLGKRDDPVSLNHVGGQIGDMLVLLAGERKPESEGGAAPVIICQQVELSEMSPSMNAVAYTSQRMLWIRAIQPISMDAYLKALEAKRRTEAMMNAKQVGTALMIFATDNDDKFPTGDPATALGPYLKNSNMMKDFVFTFPSGQDMNKIDNPGGTEIGYIPLPGGRVVTYADSHVRWVPDK